MGTGLADKASDALARAMPDNGQSRTLQGAWLDWDQRARLAKVSWQREWDLTRGLSNRTVLDVLNDFPVVVDRSPEPDRRFVVAAASSNELRKRIERRDRFGLALSAEDTQRAWLDDLEFRVNSFVLARGRYGPDNVRHGPLSVIRSRLGRPNDTANKTMRKGVLHAGTETIATHGIDPELVGTDLLVLGSAIETREAGTGQVVGYALQADYAVAADAAVPLPRWPGLTRAACLARSLCLRYLIATIDAEALSVAGVHDVDELRAALTSIHCPQTLSEVAGVELREKVGRLLDEIDDAFADAVRSRGRIDVGPLPVRSVTDEDDAEVYAEEVLRHLGFADARRTPRANDGGRDVAGKHLVCQVKFERRQTNRPSLQQLTGVACVDRASAVFFSLAGFSTAAREWAELTGIACFQFDTDGTLTAVTTWADDLLVSGRLPPRPSVQAPRGPAKRFWESVAATPADSTHSDEVLG